MRAKEKRSGYLIITLTIILALLLNNVFLPEWAERYRPGWTMLVLIYWALALPHRVGMGVAWFTGMLMDVMKDNFLLGQHALSMVIIIYIVLSLYRRIRISPMLQQVFTILLLMLLYQLLLWWFQSLTGKTERTLNYALMSVSSALIWPLLYLFLRSIRRRFRIA